MISDTDRQHPIDWALGGCSIAMHRVVRAAVLRRQRRLG